MERRSDKYTDEETKNVTRSRVSKNKLLYDDINNSKIGFDEIPTINTSAEINLSSFDMDNLKRSDYQKVKDFKDLIGNDEKQEIVEQKEEVKKKTFDINKVLEEAKKNRKKDELEDKRNLKEEDYDVLNNLNKKYLHQKGFTEEDNEELKELIDTITSKTMIDDVKDEEEKDLLSELLATTIDIKLESELSQEEINSIADNNIDTDSKDDNTDSFYSRSLELSKEDLEDKDDDDDEDTDTIETNVLDYDKAGDHSTAKIVFVVLLVLIILLIIAYIVLKALGVF